MWTYFERETLEKILMCYHKASKVLENKVSLGISTNLDVMAKVPVIFQMSQAPGPKTKTREIY